VGAIGFDREYKDQKLQAEVPLPRKTTAKKEVPTQI